MGKFGERMTLLVKMFCSSLSCGATTSIGSLFTSVMHAVHISSPKSISVMHVL